YVSADATLEQLECAAQRNVSTDPGEGIPELRRYDLPELRGGPEPASRLCTDLATLCATRSARRSGDDSHLPGYEGHARHAGVPAKHLPYRRGESVSAMSGGLHLQDVGRQSGARGRAGTVASKAASWLRSEPRLHLRKIDRRRRAGGRPGPHGGKLGHGDLNEHGVDGSCGNSDRGPGLAESPCRAEPFKLRSAQSAECSVAVHHGHGKRRWNTVERLARTGVQR